MRVEWLILADAAEVVNNKLYLLGGGWDRLTVHSEFPVIQYCAVAAAVMVPWQETEKPHLFALEVYDDSRKLLASMEAEFEVGRPPGVLPGKEQRWQFAGDFQLMLEGPGRHRVEARCNDTVRAQQEFEVVVGRRAADLPG
ncbi:MAG: hypothetical protein HY319_04995 [Armatimonadetes bacterium]|nr:hypothetical protein [Armatimonadota bacterium]